MNWKDILRKEEINKIWPFAKKPSPRGFLGEKEYNKTVLATDQKIRAERHQAEQEQNKITQAKEKKRDTGYATFEDFLNTPHMVELKSIFSKYKSGLSALNFDVEGIINDEFKNLWDRNMNISGSYEGSYVDSILNTHIMNIRQVAGVQYKHAEQLPKPDEEGKKVLNEYYRDFLKWAEKHFNQNLGR